MTPWDALLDVFRGGLFTLTHLYGGSVGLAIVTLSLVVRVALLPFTVRAARRAVLMQRKLRDLQPELQRLQAKYRHDPARLQRAMIERYRTHGIRPVRDSGLVAALLQMPIALALYTVIRQGVGAGQRFLWIASLARPDLLLAVLVTLIGAIVVAVSPAARSSSSAWLAPMVLTIVFTFWIVSRLASGVGLYWGVSNAVGAVQAWLVRRATAVPT